MGGLLSTFRTELPLELRVLQQHAVRLLDLPPEIILEVTYYLSQDDIKHLRAVCKYLDATLLATFGNRYFGRLHLIPTPTSLDILTQISTQGRLSDHVRELCICSSIYQFWGPRQTRARAGARWTKPQLRVLSETERPCPDPSSPEQEAANVCAELVRGEQFREQLTTALRSLKVQRIEVQGWPRNPSLVLGLTELIDTTGKNPFEDNFSGISPAWEYETLDMVTRMTELVFSAVKGSDTPLLAMIVDRIQIDQLKLTPDLGSNLLHLKHVEFSIALSDQSLQFSDQKRRFDLFTLVNRLPRLEQLSVSNCPYTKNDWVPLNDALMHIHPQKVRRLCLGLFWDAAPQVVDYLNNSLPNLQDLELQFTTSKDGNKAWNEMFSGLRDVLSLEHLSIDVDGHIFEFYKNDDIDSTLVWLAENMPDHWKKCIDEEDSEDEEAEEPDQEREGQEEEIEYRRGPGQFSSMDLF